MSDRDRLIATIRSFMADATTAFMMGEMDADEWTDLMDVYGARLDDAQAIPVRPTTSARKARIVARADAMTLIAEVSKRSALHTASGKLNRTASPDQIATIARCNRTLDRCHKAVVRLSQV